MGRVRHWKTTPPWWGLQINIFCKCKKWQSYLWYNFLHRALYSMLALAVCWRDKDLAGSWHNASQPVSWPRSLSRIKSFLSWQFAPHSTENTKLKHQLSWLQHCWKVKEGQDRSARLCTHQWTLCWPKPCSWEPAHKWAGQRRGTGLHRPGTISMSSIRPHCSAVEQRRI